MHRHSEEFLLDDFQKTKKRILCFPNAKAAIITAACMVIVIIIGAVCWPRYLNTDIGKPYLPTNSSLEFLGVDVFKFKMGLNISIYSPNVYSLAIDRVDWKGTLMQDDILLPHFYGQGNTTNLLVPARSRHNFTMYVDMMHSVNSTSETLIALLNYCVTNTPIKFMTQTFVTIKPLIWFGYRPEVQSLMFVDCPTELLSQFRNLGDKQQFVGPLLTDALQRL